MSSDRACGWCRDGIPATARRDAIYCSKRCRQAAHRFGRGRVARGRGATRPLRLAYADPPYPGLARRYYGGHPDFAGEVDHAELIRRLADEYDGWALSTSARALPRVLGLDVVQGLGDGIRVAAWLRGARHVRSYGPLSAWEPVVFAGGRQLAPDAGATRRLDALAHVARARTTDPGWIVGAKPAAFCWWLFDLLGALPGDSFDDLFPGSGRVAQAWDLYASSSATSATRRVTIATRRVARPPGDTRRLEIHATACP